MLENTCVIGAAGKMGSGISWLVLKEIAATKDAILTLCDPNQKALIALRSYLEQQLRKHATENIGAVRASSKWVSNSDVIDNFVAEGLSKIWLTRHVDDCASCKVVFEAALEDVDFKVGLYSKLRGLCGSDAVFFTNTSSIPIHVIEERAQLTGRIMGFHFYNPPAVQKLVELIPTQKTRPDVSELATRIGKQMGKVLVTSKDVAGFIGNGHFIRDGLFALSLIKELGLDFVSSIYTINRISQDFMLRPMGIFQLIDYVGLDVFACIVKIMREAHSTEKFDDSLIQQLLTQGVRGGQGSGGVQKDGFFQYASGEIAAVWDSKRYVPLSEGSWRSHCDESLGQLPQGYQPWKKWLKSSNREEGLRQYFKALFAAESKGAKLAKSYLMRSKDIAAKLVHDGVGTKEDVNQVLQSGFFHLYGPQNSYY